MVRSRDGATARRGRSSGCPHNKYESQSRASSGLFEPGIHFCQMQMQAGTAEYVEMRVYNPIKQAREQDPNGSFIREWVPELRGVPLAHLHEPSRMPRVAQRAAGCVVGVDYPRPIVEHQARVRGRVFVSVWKARAASRMTRPRCSAG